MASRTARISLGGYEKRNLFPCISISESFERGIVVAWPAGVEMGYTLQPSTSTPKFPRTMRNAYESGSENNPNLRYVTSFAILESDFAMDEVDIWIIKSDTATWISSECDFLGVDSKCCDDCISLSAFHETDCSISPNLTEAIHIHGCWCVPEFRTRTKGLILHVTRH